VPGVGSRKLSAYGERFVRAIGRFCDTHDLSAAPEQQSSPVRGRERRRETGAIGTAAQETLRLYRAGMSIEQIALAQQRAQSTVVGYLCQLIAAGEGIDVADFVSRDHYRRIADAFAEVGLVALRPVKDIVGEDISYTELHLVRAHLQRNG
jgi:ATP-dependent DNA helicase RecQ